MIDVKMTETDLPWFFKVAPGRRSSTRTRASRSSRLDVLAGRCRWASRTSIPESARVDVHRRVTSPATVLGSSLEPKRTRRTGSTIWDNDAAPLPVTVDQRRASACGWRSAAAPRPPAAHPLVECYDLGSANGILLAQRLVERRQRRGRRARPRARVTSSGTCADPYFVATASSCTIGVRAEGRLRRWRSRRRSERG